MNKKYNYDLKNIRDWRKEFNREIIDKTVEYQNKYNFDIGTGKHATWNNEADAFKHAFMQAKMVYKSGGIELPATILGLEITMNLLRVIKFNLKVKRTWIYGITI